MQTAARLRTQLETGRQSFPDDIPSKYAALRLGERMIQKLISVPGAAFARAGIWILGSAFTAAIWRPPLGACPTASRRHFAPDMLLKALDIYRDKFTPSAQLRGRPSVIAASHRA